MQISAPCRLSILARTLYIAIIVLFTASITLIKIQLIHQFVKNQKGGLGKR